MKENYILCLSSCLFLLPIFYYLYRGRYNKYENILVLLLFLNFICSFLFWLKGQQYSLEHKVDGFFAKLSFILFLSYILFIKPGSTFRKLLSLCLIVVALFLFFLSNSFSKEWCSKKHIVTHVLFHITILIGMFFAFI